MTTSTRARPRSLPSTTTKLQTGTWDNLSNKRTRYEAASPSSLIRRGQGGSGSMGSRVGLRSSPCTAAGVW